MPPKIKFINFILADKVGDAHKIISFFLHEWQSANETLKLFGKKLTKAPKRYRQFAKKGVNQGRHPGPMGGGLIRSVGISLAFTALDRPDALSKRDERMLVDSDFVEEVMKKAEEKRERRYQLETDGFTVDRIADRVVSILGLKSENVWQKGKHPQNVKARRLLNHFICFAGVWHGMI